MTAKDDNEDLETGDSEKKSDIYKKNNGKDEHEFPNVFYCPITKEVMQDPVVIPDGNSYERSAIEKRGDVPANKMYSNRALLEIIEETVDTSGDSIMPMLKRLDKSMRGHLAQVMEKSVLPSDEYRPLPDAYYCPITFGIMHVPVIDPEGNTFEKVTIEGWIEANGKSPITRTSMSIGDLYPNNAIAALLDEEKGKGEDSIHPSIRKWKQEEPPEAPPAPAASTNNTNASRPTQPTTEEELERIRLQRRGTTLTLVGMFFLVVLVALAVIYGLPLGFIWIALCLFPECLKSSNRRN